MVPGERLGSLATTIAEPKKTAPVRGATAGFNIQRFVKTCQNHLETNLEARNHQFSEANQLFHAIPVNQLVLNFMPFFIIFASSCQECSETPPHRSMEVDTIQVFTAWMTPSYRKVKIGTIAVSTGNCGLSLVTSWCLYMHMS